MAGNPMLEMMGRSQATPQNNPLSMMGQLKQMAQMMRGQDPQQLVQSFAQRNPQFAAFLRQNQGKRPEQIAQENGIDMGLIRQILR